MKVRPPAVMMTYERLKELLHYNPETGIFTRKICRRGWRAGSLAGTKAPDGRIKIFINGKLYFAYRLAWLYTYGKWPDGEIDHINGNPSDDRIENLRDVDRQINMQNKRSAAKNNKLNLLGVYMQHGKYFTAISVNGKVRRLGSYDTPEKASEVYLEAKRKYHPGCTI